MRQDQMQRIEELQEKLVDALLDEADPVNWPGQGKLPKELTQEERGNRYWCKKNASATLTIITKTMSLANFKDRLKPAATDEAPEPEDNIDKEIAQQEKAAEAILARFQQRMNPH